MFSLKNLRSGLLGVIALGASLMAGQANALANNVYTSDVKSSGNYGMNVVTTGQVTSATTEFSQYRTNPTKSVVLALKPIGSITGTISVTITGSLQDPSTTSAYVTTTLVAAQALPSTGLLVSLTIPGLRSVGAILAQAAGDASLVSATVSVQK